MHHRLRKLPDGVDGAELPVLKLTVAAEIEEGMVPASDAGVSARK